MYKVLVTDLLDSNEKLRLKWLGTTELLFSLISLISNSQVITFNCLSAYEFKMKDFYTSKRCSITNYTSKLSNILYNEA